MLILTSKGLYCPAGNFHIDPKSSVENAVITHAHSDHARRGSRRYFCVNSGTSLLKLRLGQKIQVSESQYGESFYLGPVKVSFHPAGHILGSCQVRLEMDGIVWVVSGDYKRQADPTCLPFEPLRCDVFVTEATFGAPSYRWPAQDNLGEQIYNWWQRNAELGKNSVLFAYSLGKAQRVLGVLEPLTKNVVHCAPAVSEMNACYRQQGIRLVPTRCLSEVKADEKLRGQLFLVPQSFLNSEQAQLLGPSYRTAFASGWMAGGPGFRGSYDQGFVMSDHADWNDLVRTVLETGARKIYVQHRGAGALVRHLRNLGLQAWSEEELKPENPAQMMLF